MVDDIDRRLICELQINARLSNVELAKKLKVVEGTIRKRIQRLLDKEIIQIVAVPNVNKLGYGFMCIMGFQVKMADLRTVADKLASMKHICYLAFVTGHYDLMAMVFTRSTQELSEFIEKEISAIPSILRTETFVNLDIIKGTGGMPNTQQLINDRDFFDQIETRN